MTAAPALLLLLRNRFPQRWLGGLSSLLSVTCTRDITLGEGGNDLEMTFLFTIRDGVDKVALLLVKQCYQRSVAVDTNLQDGISESLYHRHNPSTLN